MEVPSALEEVAAVVRGFLPPHPVAKLVKELEFEEHGECNVPEDITPSEHFVALRSPCWECHKVLNRGSVGGLWDRHGEHWDPHGEKELFCDSCMETRLMRWGYERHTVIDRGYFLLVVWRDRLGRKKWQPLDKDDAAGLARLTAAVRPRRRAAGRR
jgi:hypothetical protein